MIIPFTDGIDYGGKKSWLDNSENISVITQNIIFSGVDCSPTHAFWVGDGYYDDVTNNELCDFDGGDCCLENVLIDYCTECLCLDSGSVNATGVSGGNISIETTMPTTSTSEFITTSEGSTDLKK